MNRTASAAFCVVSTLASPLLHAQAAEVAEGPMISAVGATTGTVWARWSEATIAHVEYRANDETRSRSTASVAVTQATDYTASFRLDDLRPGVLYRYRIVSTDVGAQGAKSDHDQFFRTGASNPTSVSFAVLTDFALNLKQSKALESATRVRPDFLAFIGDFDHRDPALIPNSKDIFPPGSDDAVLSEMRTMRRDTRSPTSPIGKNLISAVMTSSPQNPQIPLYYTWDDHDFCANNEGESCPWAAQSFQTYREYFVPSPDNGLTARPGCPAGDWQRVAMGTIADIFLLDARSNRQAITPTASMLGACQKQWLLNGLRDSVARWKFVLSPVPFNPGTKPYDSWGAFPAEHDEVVDFIQTNHIKNVVVLSGDIHSGGGIDDGTHAGLPEVTVPHANMPTTWVNTYCRRAPPATCWPGTWTIGSISPIVGAISISDPPHPIPGGKQPGYARISADATSAIIEVMDESGVVRRGQTAGGQVVPLSMEITAAGTVLTGAATRSARR